MLTNTAQGLKESALKVLSETHISPEAMQIALYVAESLKDHEPHFIHACKLTSTGLEHRIFHYSNIEGASSWAQDNASEQAILTL